MSYLGQQLGQGQAERFVFTASGGETSVTTSDDGRAIAYTVGQVDVYLNGAKLINGSDFTATTGTSITGLAALTASDVVEVFALSIFQASDTVSAASGGTFNGNVTVDANLSVTGTADIDTSLNVDGTVTADGLTVNGTILATGTTATLSVDSRDGTGATWSWYNPTGDGLFAFGNSANRMQIANNGDISFYEDTGTTAKLFWDASAEALGIGTTSPAYKLEVESSSDADLVQVKSTAGANNTVLRLGISGNDAVISGSGGSTGNLAFKTYGSERMRIDSSGNVKISTSNAGNDVELRIQNSAVSSGDTATLRFSVTSNSAFDSAFVGSDRNNALILGANAAERARIDAIGNLLVGTTGLVDANGQGIHVANNTNIKWAISTSTRNRGLVVKTTATTGTHYYGYWEYNGIQVGAITSTGTTTVYGTSSDQRLKENIVDAPSASDDIDAIQVRSFDWKASGSHQKYGMVAQELLEVVPEAVSQPEDPDEMMGVDYSKLVPMLVKEIQSLRARVAQLEGA